MEAILAIGPDLVVVDGTNQNLTHTLEEAGVEVLEAPASRTLEDTYGQLVAIGVATGHAEEAEAVADGMRTEVAAQLANVPELTEPLIYYHELDVTLYAATSHSFIGRIYTMAGLVNVADAADLAGRGFAQLSAEYLITADPDLVFLADTRCCGQTAEGAAPTAQGARRPRGGRTLIAVPVKWTKWVCGPWLPQMRSMMVTLAWPPPSHMVWRP